MMGRLITSDCMMSFSIFMTNKTSQLTRYSTNTVRQLSSPQVDSSGHSFELFNMCIDITNFFILSSMCSLEGYPLYVAHLLILDTWNGRSDVESGVNNGCSYEHTVSGC